MWVKLTHKYQFWPNRFESTILARVIFYRQTCSRVKITQGTVSTKMEELVGLFHPSKIVHSRGDRNFSRHRLFRFGQLQLQNPIGHCC